METSDPQRFARGIELITSRITLELATIQNKRRDNKLKNSLLRLQHLEDEIELIDQRLVPSSNADENWK